MATKKLKTTKKAPEPKEEKLYECPGRSGHVGMLEITCGEKSPYGFTCTRELNHTSNHIACGGRMHNIATWPR